MRKLAFGLVLFSMSFLTFAKDYECEFPGRNAILTINEDSTIILNTPSEKFDCKIGYTNFPGTEVEMRVINCQGRFKKITYYYTELNDEIILSKGFVWSKDIRCKELN